MPSFLLGLHCTHIFAVATVQCSVCAKEHGAAAAVEGGIKDVVLEEDDECAFPQQLHHGIGNPTELGLLPSIAAKDGKRRQT